MNKNLLQISAKGILFLTIMFFSLFANAQSYNVSTFSRGMTRSLYDGVQNWDYDTQLWIGTTSADEALSSAQNIGFTFNYFGNDYTQFYVSTNGWISFTSQASSDATNNAIPSTDGSNNLIAVWWDDLHVKAQGSTDKVGYEMSGTSPNRVLTVEWFSISRYSGIMFKAINSGINTS